jgi:hypothetical protein
MSSPVVGSSHVRLGRLRADGHDSRAPTSAAASARQATIRNRERANGDMPRDVDCKESDGRGDGDLVTELR